MHSSTLVDHPSDHNSGDHLITHTLTDLTTEVLIAAITGQTLDLFKENRNDLVNWLSPNRNTILHLHITANSTSINTHFITEILILCPQLLAQTNAKGETPLHLAARYGHWSAAMLLVAHARESNAAREVIRMATSEEGDTALHEAVRFRHLDIVRVLTREDPEFLCPANKAGETPLYVAAERDYGLIVCEILDNCIFPAAEGPCGRTALHAATIAKNEASTERILQKLPDLSKSRDENGWTPLHYAADQNCISIAKILLKYNANAAYIADTIGRTALHIAARCGHYEILREIMIFRPGCCELVDHKGCNILHLAVESESLETLSFILGENLLSYLIYERNKDGNTPIHHAAVLHRPNSLMNAIINCKAFYSRLDIEAFNSENKNIRDIIFTDDRICTQKAIIRTSLAFKKVINFGHRILNHKDQDTNWWLDDHDPLKKDEKGNDDPGLSELEKAREQSMIVATLIATVTFTAGFTLPGGFIAENGPLQGAAVLRHNNAFKTFVVTDTIAMVLSSLAVFLHLYMALSGLNKERLFNNFQAAIVLTTLAIGAMIIAFVTGIYSVLEHSDSLASGTCGLGLSFFIFFGIMVYRNENTSRIKKIKKQIYYRQT